MVRESIRKKDPWNVFPEVELVTGVIKKAKHPIIIKLKKRKYFNKHIKSLIRKT